jgi:hypothetical protein
VNSALTIRGIFWEFISGLKFQVSSFVSTSNLKPQTSNLKQRSVKQPQASNSEAVKQPQASNSEAPATLL